MPIDLKCSLFICVQLTLVKTPYFLILTIFFHFILIQFFLALQYFYHIPVFTFFWKMKTIYLLLNMTWFSFLLTSFFFIKTFFFSSMMSYIIDTKFTGKSISNKKDKQSSENKNKQINWNDLHNCVVEGISFVDRNLWM